MGNKLKLTFQSRSVSASASFITFPSLKSLDVMQPREEECLWRRTTDGGLTKSAAAFLLLLSIHAMLVARRYGTHFS